MDKPWSWFHVTLTHEVTVRAKNEEEAEKLTFEGVKHNPHFYTDITPATKDQILPYEDCSSEGLK